MADHEPFTLISEPPSQNAYPDYESFTSAKIADIDIQVNKSMHEHYPELNVTTVPTLNCPLLQFAASGHATAEIDTKTESIRRFRGFIPPDRREGNGQLGEAIFFAKYHYKWGKEDFILYTVGSMQYILKEPGEGEDQLSHCHVTDTLIRAAAIAFLDANKYIYVYDRYWMRSKQLWEEVQKSSWDKVILDHKMKDALKDISQNFFDNKEMYEDLGVPWKRGIIFHGPAGNGKTVSTKALMKTLYDRKDPVPTLYVKTAQYTWDIHAIFDQARRMTPCLLVMEDIDTIVTPQTRSYFFNEVDGLENNSGLLMLASTNYLDRLDPGLSKRPSRFDRKYLFPFPDKDERALYASFWRNKLAKTKRSLPFPEFLCPAIADITHGFSFAYMQEAFIATLLAIARDSTEPTTQDTDGPKAVNDENDDDLNKYELWRVMKAQVKILRKDMDSSRDSVTSGDVSTMTASPADLHPRRSTAHSPESSSINARTPATWLPLRSWTGGSSQDGSQPRVLTDDKLSLLPDLSASMFGDGGVATAVGNENQEPSTEEMARNGVGKYQVFTQTAFEWRS